MSALTTLTTKLASRLDMGEDESSLIATLKATAFRGQVSDAQMTALLVVANQFNLNPWTREIYAFPDKNNGIVPVVGVDGWSRIINSHPQFDGVEFEYGEKTANHHEWIECIIYRKDRAHPTRAREFWGEVYRDSAQPWKSHPNRMHRHKALIQCARIAFGFGGIYDQDEAERIVEMKDMGEADVTRHAKNTEQKPDQKKPVTESMMAEKEAEWVAMINSGKRTPDSLISMIETRFSLSEDQKNTIRALGKAPIDAEFEQVKEEQNEVS